MRVVFLSILFFFWVVCGNAQQVSFDGPWMVTTLAGNGQEGFQDGSATEAEFGIPESVATDAAGNVYVSDAGNAKIRKITTQGIVSTLAGNGLASFADGPGVNASFNAGNGLTVDAAGNVYVADAGNERIRKITPTGLVSTVSGNTQSGYVDGSVAAARFNEPTGVVMDATGNIYVCDHDNSCIRKITPSGIVSTLAGNGSSGYTDGLGNMAQFGRPWNICIDANGNVYVADSDNNRIRKITPAGLVSTLAGSGTEGAADGAATVAQFNAPLGVGVDASGNVYVADAGNNLIRKVTPFGMVSTYAGTGAQGFADGPLLTSQFSQPTGITVDDLGNVYVADYFNNRIRKITKQTFLLNFSQCPGHSSATQYFYANGSSLTDSLIIVAPEGYEIAQTESGVYATRIALSPAVDHTVADAKFYIRLRASGIALSVDSITLSSSGALTRYLTVNAHLADCGSPVIPNLITANHDGLNDAFDLQHVKGKITLQVLNRWGAQVFYSDDYKNNWKAENVDDGVYYYDIKNDVSEKWNGWLEVINGK